MAETTNYSGGVGLPGLLFITFLVLKLCGVINWSWWWVTCPLWIPLGIVLILLCISGCLFLAAWAMGK